MNEWVKELSQMSVLFALSASVAYLYTRIARGAQSGPPLRSRLRIRMPGGMARAALISKGPFGWEVGPVLQRHDSLRAVAGDSIVVEAPDRNGVSLFRSKISSIDGTTLTIEPPVQLFNKNRRENPRRTNVTAWNVLLDGQTASLVDLSTQGARVSEIGQVTKSQRVELTIGKFSLPCWVLEVCPDRSARLLFEEPLEASILKSKTAPTS